jgi:DNA replication protein DnaC
LTNWIYPCEREATNELFDVSSARYERNSIALSSNLPFENWLQVFPDEMTAAAVIDRLVHHGTIFLFAGESHRSRQRKVKGGKPPTDQEPPASSGVNS